MPKEPRPPKPNIPATGTTAQILTLLRAMDERLTRLEGDDDRRAARAAALRS